MREYIDLFLQVKVGGHGSPVSTAYETDSFDF